MVWDYLSLVIEIFGSVFDHRHPVLHKTVEEMLCDVNKQRGATFDDCIIFRSIDLKCFLVCSAIGYSVLSSSLCARFPCIGLEK